MASQKGLVSSLLSIAPPLSLSAPLLIAAPATLQMEWNRAVLRLHTCLRIGVDRLGSRPTETDSVALRDDHAEQARVVAQDAQSGMNGTGKHSPPPISHTRY